MSNWKAAAIALKCDNGSGPQDHLVAGWVNGPFGLDFRAIWQDFDGYFVPGFVLTHLPTGYVIRQLCNVGTLEAQAIAEEILADADWASLEGKPDASHGAAVKAAMARHPGVVTASHKNLGPGA